MKPCFECNNKSVSGSLKLKFYFVFVIHKGARRTPRVLNMNIQNRKNPQNDKKMYESEDYLKGQA